MKRILICLIALLGVVQATWADTTFDINISGVNGGTVTADKTNASYGETVTLTLKPEIMNELTVVSVIGATSGKSMPLTKNDNGTYSFLMPAEPVNVSAIFTMPHEYVTDVMVIGSKDQDVTNRLRYTYEPQGWYFIDKDLNEGAHGAYIYLLYKTERSTVNKGYITDFYIKKSGSQGRPETITHNGRTYYPVRGGGGDAFTGDNIQCDLNYDANGEYIYLYYTTDPFEDNRAVFKIEFNSTKDGGVGANGGTSGCDLNSGAHGAYIYMHIMTGNPFVPGEQALWCSGNNTLYFVNNILGQSYAPGSTYKGQTVTNMWSGTKVTDTGERGNPGWNAIKDACTKVVFEPSFADVRPKSLYGWFSGFTKLKEIEGIENLNTSEVKDVGCMFLNCESLETVDVSGFDVSKISSFSQMFAHCSKLTTIYCNDSWNVGQFTFYESTKLVGAIKYQSNVYRANPIDGYFTSRTTLVDNEDNTSMLSARNQYYGDVTIEGRSLVRNNTWNTLCLPFSLNNFTGTPLEGATVKTLSSSSFEGKTGTLTLDFEKVTSVEAGKPYIVKWENGGDNITNPVFKGVTISNQINNVETDAVTFCGTFNPFHMVANDKTKLYLSGNNTLYYPSQEMNVNSFRAYFQLANGITAGNPAHGEQGVKAFVLNFDDGQVTGIISIPNPSLNGGEWYDLSGRKLSGKPTQKGVYINNGRSVVIK